MISKLPSCIFKYSKKLLKKTSIHRLLKISCLLNMLYKRQFSENIESTTFSYECEPRMIFFSLSLSKEKTLLKSYHFVSDHTIISSFPKKWSNHTISQKRHLPPQTNHPTVYYTRTPCTIIPKVNHLKHLL